MIPLEKPAAYHTGCNEFLLRAVPSAARRILEVGCGEGNLGARLKQLDPRRQVFGIEREPAVAARASQKLDRVLTLDVETSNLPIEPGSIDCILYGDVLEHLIAPEEVLRRHRHLLGEGGTILCCIPNLQHFSIITALLESDFQYADAGLLDSTHLRFFTYSTFIKLLLDCGYAPAIVQDIATPWPDGLLSSVLPLLHYLGLQPERTRRYLSAYQYIVKGTPLFDFDNRERERAAVDLLTDTEAETPLSFVVCVSNEQTLRANLLSSPCLAAGSRHEVLLVRNCATAADGLNQGLAQARNPFVVCVHQDVYLPRGWPSRLVQQYRLAESRFGRIGVLGVYGVACRGEIVTKAGHVVDRDRPLDEGQGLPAAVDTLDELLLVLPKDTPLRFDARLGFHFYGADICLAAREQGLAAVAVDALCFHHSRSVGLGNDFYQSAGAFASKWSASLPLATSCVVIAKNGAMRLS